MLRVYLSRCLFESGSTKLEVVKSAPPTGARGKTFTEKTEKESEEIIWLVIV